LSKLQRLALSRLLWEGMAGEIWANVVFDRGRVTVSSFTAMVDTCSKPLALPKKAHMAKAWPTSYSWFVTILSENSALSLTNFRMNGRRIKLAAAVPA
jgi:hypothetical protein